MILKSFFVNSRKFHYHWQKRSLLATLTASSFKWLASLPLLLHWKFSMSSKSMLNLENKFLTSNNKLKAFHCKYVHCIVAYLSCIYYQFESVRLDYCLLLCINVTFNDSIEITRWINLFFPYRQHWCNVLR